MSTKVLLLGGSGMLGSMIADALSDDPDLSITATVRSEALRKTCRERLPAIDWRLFDGDTPDLWAALEPLDAHDWVINAIGITKPLIHDDKPAQVERAVRVNALLPHLIARRTHQSGARVLQIATDCVFSGSKGAYTEDDPHDALDAYGKTKSLGEVPAPHMHHLRCSIIGPEPKEHKFLLDWFLGQAPGAGVKGYANHRWNGVTTLHFARLCRGIITAGLELPSRQHVVPTGTVTKCELLECFAEHYRRRDVSISPIDAAIVIDRTLSTVDAQRNDALWRAAGYVRPPSVPEMVAELARYDCRLAHLEAPAPAGCRA